MKASLPMGCLLAFLALACGKAGSPDKEALPADSQLQAFAGIYRLKPSAFQETLQIQSDGACLYGKAGKQKSGYVQLQKPFLRIFLEKNTDPTGVFPMGDLMDGSAKGFFQNEVRSLERVKPEAGGGRTDRARTE